MHHPTDRIAHTTAFVTPAVEHWLKQEIDNTSSAGNNNNNNNTSNNSGNTHELYYIRFHFPLLLTKVGLKLKCS